MSWPKRNMQQFLIDANVFVAAIKNPDKKSRTLDLILELISNDGIKLVGNDLLLLEFEKYSEKFRSETASHLLKQLKDKMTIIELDVNSIKNCKKYFPKNEEVFLGKDTATCLQENSILITNDKHFDKISRNKIIEVWSINRAVENLL